METSVLDIQIPSFSDLKRSIDELDNFVTKKMELNQYELDRIAKICYQGKIARSVFFRDFKFHGDSSDFGHEVISHAFQNFLAITGIEHYVPKADDNGNFEYLKIVYGGFAKAAGIPKELLDIGWQQYIED